MALILFSPNNMTTNTAPPPYVASTSTGYNFVFRLFNGAGAGECNTTFPAWWKIYIGTTARILAQYKLTGSSAGSGYSPKDWIIEGSNDNSSWTTIDAVSESTGWGVSEERTFTPDVITTAYKYFRINISDDNGSGLIGAMELKLYYDDAAGGGIVIPVFISQYRRRTA